jgi:hypothetical protein
VDARPTAEVGSGEVAAGVASDSEIGDGGGWHGGCRVPVAKDRAEAIALVESRGAEIDLALLDVVMPKAGGITGPGRRRRPASDPMARHAVPALRRRPSDVWVAGPSLRLSVYFLAPPATCARTFSTFLWKTNSGSAFAALVVKLYCLPPRFLMRRFFLR